MNRSEIVRMMTDEDSEHSNYIDFQLDTVDWPKIVDVIANALAGDVPTVAIPYTDGALVPMLGVRKAVLEQHGLMKDAREVGEQMIAVGDWQRVNLDKLTPYPGVIPTEASKAVAW